ncbi:hypothetical protein GGS26DRAFT_32315 [Hypomontagnella submonticulosa]|nr:hypothetical protein GGS26DRAFT_32315 [Hypomontagnella submonticulosa]
MNSRPASSTPPSSPLRGRSPELPQLDPTPRPKTPLPLFTSERSELSELSDLGSTPIASVYEEQQEENEPQWEPSLVVTETVRFWQNRWRRNFNFESFLTGWLLERTERGFRHRSRLSGFVDILKDPAVREELRVGGVRIQFDDEDESVHPEFVSALRKEFIKLRTGTAFGTFNPEVFNRSEEDHCNVEDVCSTQWLEDVLGRSKDQLQTKSPMLYALLTQLLANQRSDRGPGSEDPFTAKTYLVSSIILNAFSPKASTFLSTMIGIYLHNSGVPRRVIESLAVFGVSASYYTILNHLHEMSGQATVGPGSSTPRTLSNEPEEPQTRGPQPNRRRHIGQLHGSHSGSSPPSKRRHAEPNQLSDCG